MNKNMEETIKFNSHFGSEQLAFEYANGLSSQNHSIKLYNRSIWIYYSQGHTFSSQSTYENIKLLVKLVS